MRKWSDGLSNIKGYCGDSFDDFVQTVADLTGHRTLPQLLGVAFIVGVYAILMVALWSIVSGLLALPVMWAWNASLPKLFGLAKLSYWNAYCINLLSALLFRGNSVKL